MLQILVLERVEPERNVHRNYVLAVEPTLFGDLALRREWGRLGQRGGSRRLDLYAEPDAAMEALTTWLKRKQGRGYTLAAVEVDRCQRGGNGCPVEAASIRT